MRVFGQTFLALSACPKSGNGGSVLLTMWIVVYSSLFSSSLSKIRQCSSIQLTTGVFHLGLLRNVIRQSKIQSYIHNTKYKRLFYSGLICKHLHAHPRRCLAHPFAAGMLEPLFFLFLLKNICLFFFSYIKSLVVSRTSMGTEPFYNLLFLYNLNLSTLQNQI